MQPQILRKNVVAATVGLSPDTIERMVAAGAFPKPIRLSSHAVGWRADEVLAWIGERTAQRDGAQVA